MEINNNNFETVINIVENDIKKCDIVGDNKKIKKVHIIVDEVKEKEMYNITLKFVNIILTNNNIPNIHELTEFRGISRQDIIKEENVKSLYEMENVIFGPFDKTQCGFYKKTTTIVVNILRYMCRVIGYELHTGIKVKHVNNFKTSTTVYTIKKITSL